MNKIVVDQCEMHLEPRIMRLLVLLCSRPGVVFSKSTLIETIWASKSINEEGLTKAISVLRKTLQNPLFIKTVPKQGYSFEGEIEMNPIAKQGQASLPWLRTRSLIALVSSLIVLMIFSFIHLDTDTANVDGASFEYTYVTNSKGLHLFPALSSTDLIAYVRRNERDENFKLIIQSTQLGKVIYQSPKEVGNVGYPVFSPASDAVAFIAKLPHRINLNVLHLENGYIETLHVLGKGSLAHVDWSPDGSLLAFTDKPNDQDYQNLYAYHFGTQEVSQLTDHEFNEYNPVFSSDGIQIAFLQSYPNGTQKCLSVYSMESGTTNILKKLERSVYDHDWTDLDQTLLFTSRDGFGSFIHKLDLSNGDESIISNQNFSQLSVQGDRILASNYGSDHNLWMRSLIGSHEDSRSVVNSGRHEFMGVLSPDRSKIVYASNRSGSYQLWTYHFEHTDSKQLTFLKGALPYDKVSWSHDSKSVLVGVRDKGQTKIIGISIENGDFETYLHDDNLNRFPNYYSVNEFHFLSDRSGMKELWSFDIQTRQVKKLSHLSHDIDFAQVSEDGMLYFSETKADGIWKSTLAGENAIKVIAHDPSDYANWELVDFNIYYMDRNTNPPSISRLNIQNNQQTVVQELLPENQSWYTRFSVAADQSFLVYNQLDHYQSDIVLLGEK